MYNQQYLDKVSTIWSLMVLADQRLLNKFFDSIIPSMRTSKIQNGCQGGPKWPTGYGPGSNPRFLGASVNFL